MSEMMPTVPPSDPERSIRLAVAEGHLWGDGTRLPVELMDESGERVASAAMVPNDTVTFDVRQGRYVVRMRLPNGEWMTRRVDTSDADADLLFRIARTEHEWLAKQEMTGEASGRWINLDHRAFGLTWSRLWSNKPLVALPSPPPVRDAPDAVKFEIHTPPHEGIKYFQIGGPNVPWQLFTLPPVGRVEVTVSVEGRDESSPTLRVSVITHDWEPEWLLRYLNLDAIDSATNVFDHAEMAERYLYSKLSDPLGAAVAGYYLLRIGDLDRMHDWPRNLADWIEWLPDGPIIHAWQMLRTRGETARLDVRARLLEALDRGLPMFTEGVRLLGDALRLLDDGHDDDLRRARDIVGDLGCALDWARPLVSFPGIDPRTPTIEPRFGLLDQPDVAFVKHTPVPTRYADVVALAGPEATIPQLIAVSTHEHMRRHQPAIAASLLDDASRESTGPQALEWLEESIAIDPTHVDRVTRAGELALELGDYGRGLSWYRMASDLAPNQPDIITRVADLATEMGDHDSAIRAYRRVLDLEPERTDLLYRFGDLVLQTGDTDEVVGVAARLAEADINSAIRMYLEAAKQFEYREVTESAAHCLRQVGELEMRRNRPDAALRSLTRAADLYFELNDDAAVDIYRAIASLAATAGREHALRKLASIFENNGDVDQAIEHLALVADETPEADREQSALERILELYAEVGDDEAVSAVHARLEALQRRRDQEQRDSKSDDIVLKNDITDD